MCEHVWMFENIGLTELQTYPGLKLYQSLIAHVKQYNDNFYCRCIEYRDLWNFAVSGSNVLATKRSWKAAAFS